MGRMSVIKLPQTGFTLSENVVKRVGACVCMFLHVLLYVIFKQKFKHCQNELNGNEGRHKVYLSTRNVELLRKYLLNQLLVMRCA